ncbi:peptidyl-prolyl cis-trans isomerase FKBP16-1, chloroplastic isoform X2 [Impatiens glandulifera]|nr:peptidyl-prolyl cis-trans isomerase FKBP16-1, chloroplastic isoform X2 [Impatiens glandulifera]
MEGKVVLWQVSGGAACDKSFVRTSHATNNFQNKITFTKYMGSVPPCLPVPAVNIPRRSFLGFLAITPFLLNLSPVLGAPSPENDQAKVIRTMKLDSGVRLQDIVKGEGLEARGGDLVELNYVCRRSNGYFVHSTVDQFSGESNPVILTLDENKIIKGLMEVLVGMKIGGKRRALIPPSVGYINEKLQPIPDEFGPRRSLLSHTSEDLIFEVQLLKVL